MKNLILLLLTISTSQLFAQDVQKKGLHKLSPHTDVKWVSRTFLKYEIAEINLSRSQSESQDFRENHVIIEESIGYQIVENTFLIANLNYGISEQSSLRFGDTDAETYTVRGFQEPSFKIFSRRKASKEDKNSTVDFFLSYTPSFGKAEFGRGDDNNRLLGKEVYEFQASYGTYYDYWDLKLGVNYKYYGSGKQKNNETGEVATLKPFSETEFIFEAQHLLCEDYYIRAGIGLRIIDDADVVRSSGTSTIQNGTGSRHYIGLARQFREYVGIVKLERLRNDYFIKDSSASFEGDYTFKSLSFELLRKF